MGGIKIMNYYKDINNKVFAFESDGSQDDYIDESLTLITKQQADDIIASNQAEPELKTKFASLEYLDRFTDAEEDSIIQAADSNIQIKKYYNRLLAATFIDLEDPRTVAGIDALISAGLLESSRKAQLLRPE